MSHPIRGQNNNLDFWSLKKYITLVQDPGRTIVVGNLGGWECSWFEEVENVKSLRHTADTFQSETLSGDKKKKILFVMIEESFSYSFFF